MPFVATGLDPHITPNRPYSLRVLYQVLDEIHEIRVEGFSAREYAARAIEHIRSFNANDVQFAQVYLSQDEHDTTLITRENLVLIEIIEMPVMYGLLDKEFQAFLAEAQALKKRAMSDDIDPVGGFASE